ncbi:tRNA modification GTPase MnmE [Clostridia bacterium]|nr:tRNA modification GTPase MnmE [Clostridia bacterium]
MSVNNYKPMENLVSRAGTKKNESTTTNAIVSSGQETIAAVSTASGMGGIGIVRLSGDSAEEILTNLFAETQGIRGQGEQGDRRPVPLSCVPLSPVFEDRRMRHGWIVDPVSNETIDEVLCVLMRAPHSYTGEDVAEIQCHGGPIPLRRILGAAYAFGAVPAEPGEFTKRAFLNGRLDLVQAGAVIDLINSRTDLSYRAASELAAGRLSAQIREARELLLEVLAEIAARIDYPEAYEHEVKIQPFIDSTEPSWNDALTSPLRAADKILHDLLDGADRGKLVRDGMRVSIIGRPNVGKSSLYNAMLRTDAAIVAEEPGTTRDTLETWLDLGGATVALTDTAGIRKDAGAVEQAGIRRAHEAYDRADVCLFVLDGSAPISEEDRQIARSLREDKPTILVVNKNDLQTQLSDEDAFDLVPSAIALVRTTLTGQRDTGQRDRPSVLPEQDRRPVPLSCLAELESLLYGLVTGGKMAAEQNFLVTREAHKAALENASTEIGAGLMCIAADDPPEFVEISVREAYRILGEIIGEEVTDEVINRVFEGFCVGK